MIIEINPNKKLKDINSAFSNAYPFLKLEFQYNDYLACLLIIGVNFTRKTLIYCMRTKHGCGGGTMTELT